MTDTPFVQNTDTVTDTVTGPGTVADPDADPAPNRGE